MVTFLPICHEGCFSACSTVIAGHLLLGIAAERPAGSGQDNAARFLSFRR